MDPYCAKRTNMYYEKYMKEFPNNVIPSLSSCWGNLSEHILRRKCIYRPWNTVSNILQLESCSSEWLIWSCMHLSTIKMLLRILEYMHNLRIYNLLFNAEINIYIYSLWRFYRYNKIIYIYIYIFIVMVVSL